MIAVRSGVAIKQRARGPCAGFITEIAAFQQTIAGQPMLCHGPLPAFDAPTAETVLRRASDHRDAAVAQIDQTAGRKMRCAFIAHRHCKARAR